MDIHIEERKMDKKNELAVALNQPIQLEKFAMRPEDLTGQVNLIQKVMQDVMKEGEHYGKIPGTDKPTLLQPGAEKLLLTFRLGTEFTILKEIEEKDFISYTIQCELFHIPTGNKVAAGIGACNSRESKYRYRYDEESTGRPVPKEYWDARKSGDNREMKRILGGEGFRVAKIDEVWVIAKAKKVEHDNPWDFQNTILKMAAKRAKVAATLNATAASDIFAQDLEDTPESNMSKTNLQRKKQESKYESSHNNGNQSIPKPSAGNGKEAGLRKQIIAKLIAMHGGEEKAAEEWLKREMNASFADLDKVEYAQLSDIWEVVNERFEQFKASK